jgi:biotin carboxyl carrier protein
MNEDKELSKIVIDDVAYETKLTSKYLRRKSYVSIDPNKIFAYIPGVIAKINVYEGQKVSHGQSILVLEAMKMKNDVTCPKEGKIKIIHVKELQMVVKGQLLIELE